MNRIQKVSTGLKALFLIAAVGTALLSFCATIDLLEAYDGGKLDDMLSLFIWSAIYWYAYRLFRQCSRGHFFSMATVRSLRRIGSLAIALGLADGIISFAGAFHNIPHWVDLIFLPCYSFSIVPGIAFLRIAWIMDEGRKIQEEQALTV